SIHKTGRSIALRQVGSDMPSTSSTGKVVQVSFVQITCSTPSNRPKLLPAHSGTAPTGTRGEPGPMMSTTSSILLVCGPNTEAKRFLAWAFGILVCLQLNCRSGTCPTIGCQPQVQLMYQNSIVGSYHLAVTYENAVYEADCPLMSAVPITGIKSCDGGGLLLTGVDLGHGSNDTVELSVSIDSGTPLTVTATLHGLLNTRDCDIVCFDHRGTV